jgi:hypothetical protein
VSFLAGNFPLPSWNDLATRLSASFDGTTTLNGSPNGYEKFVGNLNLTGSDRSYFNKIKQITAKCSSPILVTIINSQMNCIGACGLLNQTISLNFKSNNLFTNYYFSFGCTNDTVLSYSTFILSADTNTLYTNFQYRCPNGRFDSNSKLLGSAQACPPGKQSNLINGKNAICADSGMSDLCNSGLQKNCADLDFGQIMKEPKTAYPPNCDYVTQSVDREDPDFVKGCLKFLTRFIREGTLNLEASTFEKTNNILADYTTSPNSLRFLQTDTSISIVPAADDTTSSDQTFTNVVLSPGDITVDGSTSSQTGSVSDGVNQINSLAITGVTSTSSTSSSSYIHFFLTYLN